MAKSVDADQTGSTLIAPILKFVSNIRQLFAANDFSRRHNQMTTCINKLHHQIPSSEFVCDQVKV